MIVRLMQRLSWMGLIILIMVTLGVAIAASNSVPETGADIDTSGVYIEDLKPSDCAGLTLTNLVTGSGTIQGTNAADLILGSAGADIIRGGNGDDCIVGGGGDDDLRGMGGNDVLLGQGGDDVLDGGPFTDVCDGGSGTDTADKSCESTPNVP